MYEEPVVSATSSQYKMLFSHTGSYDIVWSAIK
jgi:hypothetical protein